ncbi:MAG TPA: hypothetical protein VE127_15365 [Solirubrobacteraceae bacterium]|jgi:hypothetical protein|nr:hypothetical protein [Solirubrobacteraceae bacterium]
MLAPAVTFADFVLAIHILGAILGFGITFVYPLFFRAAMRWDPTVLPWLLRMRQKVGRYFVNTGLTFVVIAGIYLASDEHYWSSFFVAWGIAAALVIGGIEGAIIIPRSGRLATTAERDLAATSVPGGGRRSSARWSEEYLSGYRLLAISGWALQAIVVVTVFLMATHA